MSNILTRTITGAFFISLILFPLFFSKEISTGILAVFMLLALIEFYQLFKGNDHIEVNWEVGIILALFISGIWIGILNRWLPHVIELGIFPLIFGAAIIELWRKKKNPIFNIAVMIFGVLYVTIPFLLMIHIHHFDHNAFPLLAGMFILIWMNDTFAYLSGRFFGKHKLIERISPKKTWEGTIGGIIFTILAGVAIGFLFDDQRILFWIVAAVIVAPCAVFGDLLESLIKRNVNVKDSGNLLPGHGGVLDRFDATLITVPFFLVWTAIYIYF